MARHPRPDLPGIPQHIIQRGNNRLPCFLDDGDRHRYLTVVAQALTRFGCRLHAYVLMTNHVHLLITPPESGALSRLMQTFSRNYVGLFNGRHGRTGTLWEGRYKACLVDSDHYLLACMLYIELNPVRAWMVELPDDYAWSSFRSNAHCHHDLLLTPHDTYQALAPDPASRRVAYRQLFEDALPAGLVTEIRAHLKQQRAFGGDPFKAWVEARTGRFSGVRPAGRPVSRGNCR